MHIDWPRYTRPAKEEGLTGIEVVRLIQKETNRKVNVSEVKRAWPEQNLQRLASKPKPLTSLT